MPSSIRFGGKLLREPQAATAFKVGQPPTSNPLATGRVMVLGQSDGGLSVDQDTIYWFSNAAEAEAILRAGVALRCIKYIFNPSPNYQGAEKVGYVRAAAAVKSSLTLDDSSTNDILKLTSKDAGAWTATIRTKVETATITGKKVSIQEGTSKDPEVGDNLTEGGLVIMCTDPVATACTVSVNPVNPGSSVTLTTTATGGTAGNLSIDLATYDTLQKVVDYINSQTYYQAYLTGADGTLSSVWLDMVAAADCYNKVEPSGTTYAAGATSISITTNADTAVGDYVYLFDSATGASEWIKVGTGSTTTSIVLDTSFSPNGLANTYTVATTTMYGSEEGELYCDLYAVYKWVNDNSSLVVAEREVDSDDEGEAPPVNIDWTYLTGGLDGTLIATKLAAALTNIEGENVQYLFIASEIQSFHVMGRDHCKNDAQTPRRLVCGGSASETVAQAKARAAVLNSDRAIPVYPGVVKEKTDGSGTETLSSMYDAALYCGLRAGLAPHEPATYKTISCLGLEKTLTKAEREDLINSGVCSLRYREGVGYIVNADVNSLQNNTQLWIPNLNKSPENSLTGLVDQTLRELQEAAERVFIGGTSRVGKTAVEAFMSSSLNRFVAEGYYSEAEDPTTGEIQPPWQNLTVYRQGDAWFVSWGFRATYPMNFFLMTAIAL